MATMRDEAEAVPSHAETKFDRQLRVWGADGQRALEAAHVILLGATSVGCETLKNLVLPNVGRCSIVDDRAVNVRDCGSNFFVSRKELGQPIAVVAARYLQELNHDVQCGAMVMSPVSFLQDHLFTASDLLGGVAAAPTAAPGGSTLLDGKRGTGVGGGAPRRALILICTPAVPQRVLANVSLRLSSKFVQERRPCVLFYVETCGMLGVVRMQAPTTFVVHAHPDPETVVRDWRIFHPFDTLHAWFLAHDPRDETQFGGGDFDSLRLHAHIPWPCIVYHALDVVRRERRHCPAYVPTLPADFAELRTVIRSMIRRQEPKEEAFLQALDECNITLDTTRRLSPRLRALLDDPRAQDPHSGDDLCWFFFHALRQFRETHHGQLPLHGDVADLATTTEWFTQLQGIYREQALREEEEVFARVIQTLERVYPIHGHDLDKLRSMTHEVCRNAWHLALVCFRPFHKAMEEDAVLSSDFPRSSNTATDPSLPSPPDLQSQHSQSEGRSRCIDAIRPYATTVDDDNFMAWYAVHCAAREFHDRHQRFAGDTDSVERIYEPEVLQQDVHTLKNILASAIIPAEKEEGSSKSIDLDGKFGGGIDGTHATQRASWMSPALLDQRVEEIARYGGGELNAVATVVGAVCAQEVIKHVQQRRIPAHDVLVFDGNLCALGALQLL